MKFDDIKDLLWLFNSKHNRDYFVNLEVSGGKYYLLIKEDYYSVSIDPTMEGELKLYFVKGRGEYVFYLGMDEITSFTKCDKPDNLEIYKLPEEEIPQREFKEIPDTIGFTIFKWGYSGIMIPLLLFIMLCLGVIAYSFLNIIYIILSGIT